MSKHTPGPWDWFTGMDSNSALIKSSSPGMRFFVGANGQGFAHTVGLSGEEDVANANLIAAAPELLEALQAIVDCCNEDHAARDYASQQTEIRGIARYAIAKATGEPT